MIEIEGKVVPDIDVVLKHFEPRIGKLINMYIGGANDKEDCKQELRIKIWRLHSNKEKTFNTSYISTRCKWDIVNFINRDNGYNWWSFFSPLNHEAYMKIDPVSDIETKIELISIIKKVKKEIKPKQYEAFCLYLCGADRTLISLFLGKPNKNLTTYYSMLSEAQDKFRRIYKESDGQEIQTKI
jgi:hypothetical protein